MQKLAGFGLGAALFFALCSSGNAGNQEHLVFACNEFPPQKMQHSPDGLAGYDVDILRAAFRVSGIGVTVEYYPWKRAFEVAKRGEVDGLCSCSYAPERTEWFDYSDQMGDVGIGYFYREDDAVLGKGELNGKKIAVVRGYALQKDLEGEGAILSMVGDDAQGLKLAKAGRVVGFYSYRDPGLYLIRKNPDLAGLNFKEAKNSPYYTCISKAIENHEAIRDKFNLGLNKIISSGEIDIIMKRYK